MEYQFVPNSIGRDVIETTDDQKTLRSLLNQDVLFHRAAHYNSWGEPIPTERSNELNCCMKKPQKIRYKWQRGARNQCEPGGMNRFDPAELDWMIGSMGVPAVYARFDRADGPQGFRREEGEFRKSIHYYDY